MCLCLVKYPKAVITRKTLRNCHLSNQDGSGLAFAHAGKLFIEKGYFGFRRLYKRFREIERSYPESCIVVHFRTMTSGGKSEETCHPFYVNDNLAFAHNGIFSGLGTLQQSDTQVFNNTILKKLPNNFLKDPKIFDLVKKYADKSFSKLVFLDNENNITIFNPDNGIWEDGIWFSNNGYKLEYYNGYTGCYSKSSYFGFSDDDYGYSSTRRACNLCGVYQPLTNMEWDSIRHGWVCESCQKLIEGYSDDDWTDVAYKCTICKDKCFSLVDGIYKSGKFYCYSCWAALKLTFSIICPYCGNSIVLDWKDRCFICNQIIDEEDYAPQLVALEHLN